MDRDENIREPIDCLLEEAVGGVAAPDVSARVVELLRRHPDGRRESPGLALVASEPEGADHHHGNPVRRLLLIGAGVAVAACLIVALGWNPWGGAAREDQGESRKSIADGDGAGDGGQEGLAVPAESVGDPVPVRIVDPSEIGSLDPGVRHILSSTIGDHDISRIAALTELRILDLRENPRITGNGLLGLASCRGLEQVDLSGCAKVDDAGMGGLTGSEGLKSLNLSRTGVTDNGLRIAGRMSRLESLYLGGLEISDRGLLALNRLTRLRTLHLWDCREVTTAGLLALQGHMDLAELAVHRCPGVPPEDDERLVRAFPNVVIRR